MKINILTIAIFMFSHTCTANSIFVVDSSKTKTDTILLNRNDNRYFEADYDSKNKISFREVNTVLDSARTIMIELSYNNETGTMLKISNPFSKHLIYKAELYAFRKDEYIETSTVPVFPRISSYETWPYKIDRIRLTSFRLKTN